MRILVSVLIFLFALAAHAQESPIQQLLQRQQGAWNHQDLDGFMAGEWNSPDLTFFGTEKNFRLAGHSRSLSPHIPGRRPRNGKTGTFQPVAPDAAFVRGAWKLTMSDGKTPQGLFSSCFANFPRDGRSCTTTLRRNSEAGKNRVGTAAPAVRSSSARHSSAMLEACTYRPIPLSIASFASWSASRLCSRNAWSMENHSSCPINCRARLWRSRRVEFFTL
jgi:hypothetical protein